ncbi:hypothetical protein [Pseudomonas sp. 18175]|uniref:hypothetical protein n=1 Tax=Pseudomonas sp. 18175 TaxID=3390056 RepID=UPI003D2031CD
MRNVYQQHDRNFRKGIQQLLSSIKVAILNENQNIWLIRSTGGQFARHFRSANLIAIKHLQSAYKGDCPDIIPSNEKIKDRLLNNDDFSEFRRDSNGKETKFLTRSGSVLLGQIDKFVNNIMQGDLILTKNEFGDYSVGICNSDLAYIDHTLVKFDVADSEQERPSLNYKLRKEVTWGPNIKSSDLPSTVRKATSGQQTVTCLNDSREKIFHLIYPFFTDGEHLFFSNKIKTNDEINALVIGKLFQNVSLSEHLIHLLLNGNTINASDFTKLIDESFLNNFLSSTCKAEFMSPGDMWSKIPLDKTVMPAAQILAGVLACLIMTGQITAESLDKLNEKDNSSIINLKRAESAPESMFNDKYKPAETLPIFKTLTTNAKKQKEQLEELDKERSISEINDRLKLKVTETKTDKLENFEYGINVFQIGAAQ